MSEDALRRELSRFDLDGSGAIDEGELGRLLEALGVRFSLEQTHVAFAAIDVNGNRRIDFGELRAWWQRRGG